MGQWPEAWTRWWEGYVLVGNALRHTPASGAVSVQVSTTAEGVQVQVADTGEGN